MTDDPVRVLVGNDTVTYRRIVSDALAKMEQLGPDLLTLDLERR